MQPGCIHRVNLLLGTGDVRRALAAAVRTLAKRRAPPNERACHEGACAGRCLDAVTRGRARTHPRAA